MLLKMTDRAFSRLGAYLSKFRGCRIVDVMAEAADRFSRAIDNENYDYLTNGELRVLKCMGDINPRCIFDVGGNRGNWCTMVAALYPAANVHVFEIVPATARALSEETQDQGRIIVNEYGLSDYNGKMEISVNESDSQTATAFKVQGWEKHAQYYTECVVCNVRMASDYIVEKNISTIDFMKIDVEGGELRVIKGIGEKIRMVRVLQFEYGRFNISSKDLLCDFYRHLSSYGFVVGRIYLNHVKFSNYIIDAEKFTGGNYLAVKEDEIELIRKLSSYG